ncbi:hypothetical protein AB0J35_57695 [Nonomuraea angiospora]|uniref:hypothetical protein n=1 Tax=Nonomuraea angiospora TaxID=46172 RepID=UPI00342FE8DC
MTPERAPDQNETAEAAENRNDGPAALGFPMSLDMIRWAVPGGGAVSTVVEGLHLTPYGPASQSHKRDTSDEEIARKIRRIRSRPGLSETDQDAEIANLLRLLGKPADWTPPE